METLVKPADRTQVLRSIDKYDRLGRVGVYELLTTGRTDESSHFMPGCGLNPLEALAILRFIETGAPKQMDLVASRFDMMIALEETVVDETTGRTAWDVLLDMKPENIAWALDDLVDARNNRCLAQESAQSAERANIRDSA